MFNRNAFDSRGIRNSISLIHELDFSISTRVDVQNYANRGCCARWDRCLPHCAVLPVICWDCQTSAVLLPYPDDGIQRLPCSQNSLPVRTDSIRIGFNQKQQKLHEAIRLGTFRLKRRIVATANHLDCEVCHTSQALGGAFCMPPLVEGHETSAEGQHCDLQIFLRCASVAINPT